MDQDDTTIATGIRRGNLYYLSGEQVKDDQVHVSDARLNTKSKELVWHQRFGHLNERSLRTLASQEVVKGFDYNPSEQMPFCESCVEGKMHKTPFPSESRKRAEVPLGLVHSDVCGPLGAESLSGAKYFVTFVDDKTHHTWVYFLKCKSCSWNRCQIIDRKFFIQTMVENTHLQSSATT